MGTHYHYYIRQQRLSRGLVRSRLRNTTNTTVVGRPQPRCYRYIIIITINFVIAAAHATDRHTSHRPSRISIRSRSDPCAHYVSRALRSSPLSLKLRPAPSFRVDAVSKSFFFFKCLSTRTSVRFGPGNSRSLSYIFIHAIKIRFTTRCGDYDRITL